MKTLIIFFLIFLCSLSTYAREIVKVGAYEFKPYHVTNDSKDITRETIRLLNSIQKDYEFKLVPIPAKRRYDSINNGTIDLIFYEDVAWGWKNSKIHFHPLPVVDGEVFFSRNSRNKTDEYFKVLNHKTIAVIMGYHYKFTSFQDFEKKKFPFQLTSAKDAEQVIDITLSGRADIGVLANSYLKYSIKTNKHFQNTLTLSSVYDHHYKLGIIQGTKTKITKEKMGAIVENLCQSDQYITILKGLDLVK